MQIFSCLRCRQVLFFESTSCVRCGQALVYLPDQRVLVAAPAADQEGAFSVASAGDARYRRCANFTDHGVCNWAVPDDDPNPLCRSCRLNRVIPNLDAPEAKAAWQTIEIAKRRLVHTLLALGLPVESKVEAPDRGLAFEFLAPLPGQPVTTGHADGVITLDISEADDPFREKMRVELGETYRTLLGHLRHEVGHYYWQRLVADGPLLDRFRDRFGDERGSYADALERHYRDGAAPTWADSFVSAYASAHPWEDWAETWAHYLHMFDTLDTARAYGLTLDARPANAPAPRERVRARSVDLEDFDALVASWIPLTIALNSLNRSMGLRDAYPFVLAPPAVEKLRFVHDVMAGVRAET